MNEEIEFLGYSLRQFDENSLWIEFPSGEGMQYSKNKLAEIFERIYKEDF